MNELIQRSLIVAALLTLAALWAVGLRAQTNAPATPPTPSAQRPSPQPLFEQFRSMASAATSPGPMAVTGAVGTLTSHAPAVEAPTSTESAPPQPPVVSTPAPTEPLAVPTPPAPPATAPGSIPTPVTGVATQRLISLSFQDAPLDQILTLYSELTGRTMIKAQGINATITLRSATKLTEDEVRQAIEAVLALNNITLVPFGEKFFKVVQPATARQEGMGIRFESGTTAEADAMVSQVVELKYADLHEVIAVLPLLLHQYAKVQPLERANAILITDTEVNVRRAMELIQYIDRPAESRVETRIYELREAAATDVAQRLNELISDTAQQRRPTVVVQTTAQTPPGVIRPPPTTPTIRTDLSLAERGIIVGQVKIVPDERTNILIIISDPANFPFFDNIVQVLDRAVEPETQVKVYSLDYAAADEVADLLNALIGASSSYRRSRTTGTTASRTGPTASRTRTPTGGSTATESRSQTLREYIASQLSRTPTPSGAPGPDGEGTIELSPETRILPDLRSNSLLLMGRKTDLQVLQEVIKELDVMLAQVVIEAVIIEVTLSDEISTGMDWLQRSLVAYDTTRAGPGGGVVIREPVMSWGGGFLSGNTAAFRSGADVGRDVPLSSGALTYYLTMEGLNLDAVLRLAARDSRARILSTPIILTTDNTEAKIIAGEERPIVTATTVTSGGNQTSAYEYKNIGIELTVKPRINPQRMVVMEVTQTADNVGDVVIIDGNEVPVVTKRELSASVAVANRSTIVLGGLVSHADRNSRTKVPLLGDIPIVGNLFRSDNRSKQRTELLVLLTPYVLMTPQEARAETRRIHDASSADSSRWFERNLGDSDLARDKRAELPPERPDTKLPPRIEHFLKDQATNEVQRGGVRTIVVPQTIQPMRPPSEPRRTQVPTPTVPTGAGR